MEKYGDVLKRLRKKSKLKVRDVIYELNNMGIVLSPSALYNYENNTRAVGADVLLALCQIYKCTNILGAFSDMPVDYSVPTDEEWELIEKYRALDSRGKSAVIETLNREFDYIERK